MKYIITLLFLLISFISFSQENFTGTYCSYSPGGYGSICINFVKNNEFEYETSGCLGVQGIGKGKYRYKKGILQLSFNNDKSSYKSDLDIKPLSENQNQDSVTFYFEIYDKYNHPLPADIRQKSIKSKSMSYYPLTLKGRTTIPKPKDSNVENYTVFFLGFEPFEFSIKNDMNKKVIINLAESSPNIISNKIFKYNISEIGADYFITDKEMKFIKSKNQISSQ